MDSAQNRPFSGYTTAQLKMMVDSNSVSINSMPDVKAAMIAEIARREKVAAGDLSVATPSERLRLQK
jgi:hypothetical protein